MSSKPTNQPPEGREDAKKEPSCTLTNEELIKRCKEWVYKLAETGGNAWSLRVPVDFNNDPDILFMELGKRLSAPPATVIQPLGLQDGIIRDLKSLRNYFGEHDKTMEEHRLYTIADKLLNSLTTAQPLVLENDNWQQKLIGRVKERFNELEEKKFQWHSFYHGWLEGRFDMKVSATPPPQPFQDELKEIKEAFQWTWDNMGTDHTSDHFNIPANGIAALDRIIEIGKDGYAALLQSSSKSDWKEKFIGFTKQRMSHIVISEVISWIENNVVQSTQSSTSEEERDNFSISFAIWALHDPQAKSYQEAGITAYGLLEKYKDRPYINTDTSKQ